MAVQMLSPKKFALYFTAVLILSAIFLSTCSDTSEYGEASDYEKLGAADTISPIISSISPTDNSSDVAVNTSIAVTFNEKISTSTATTNTSDTTCSGSFQLSSDNFSSCIKMSATPSASNGDKTFTITPSDNLSGRVTYQLKLTTPLKDANGVALETYTTIGFITYYNRFTSGSGTISGNVKQDTSGNGLSGVSVEYNIGGYTKTVTSDSDGNYGIYSLSTGSYSLLYTKTSYIPTTKGATLVKDTDNITIGTFSMVDSNCTGGNISGTITDAVSQNAVSGASISIRVGGDNISGSTISGKTDTTANNGTYTISNIDPRQYGESSYTIEASKSGYMTEFIPVDGLCTSLSGQDTYMRETLPDGAMSIVLLWYGDEDFDSHLEIPVTDSDDGDSNDNDSTHLHWGTNQAGSAVTFSGASTASTRDYHIYTDIVSSASNSSGDYVTLDVDNQDGNRAGCSSGCGPETITISKLRESGTYRYHVHAFSQKGNAATQNDIFQIADNGTRVTVYYNPLDPNIDGFSKRFYPQRVNADLWSVFDFSVSDNFTELNIFSSEQVYTNVDNH